MCPKYGLPEFPLILSLNKAETPERHSLVVLKGSYGSGPRASKTSPTLVQHGEEIGGILEYA